MLLTDVAFIFPAQSPFRCNIPLKVPCRYIIIIFDPLIIDELWIVDKSRNHKLINFIIIKSTMTLLYLAAVDGLEIIDDLLLLSEKNVIFIFLSLLIEGLSLLKHSTDWFWAMYTQVAPHDGLVINIRSFRWPYRLIKLIHNFRPIIFDKIFFTQSKYVKNIGHKFLSLFLITINLIIIQMYSQHQRALDCSL